MKTSTASYVTARLVTFRELDKRRKFFDLIADFPFEEMLEKSHDQLMTNWLLVYTHRGREIKRYVSLDGHLYNDWVRSYLTRSPAANRLLLQVVVLIMLSTPNVSSVRLYRCVSEDEGEVEYVATNFYFRLPSAEKGVDEVRAAVLSFSEDDPLDYFLNAAATTAVGDVMGIVRDPIEKGAVEGYAYMDEVNELLDILAGQNMSASVPYPAYELSRLIEAEWHPQEQAEALTYTVLSKEDLVEAWLQQSN